VLNIEKENLLTEKQNLDQKLSEIHAKNLEHENTLASLRKELHDLRVEKEHAIVRK
jgi:hypothetical protein